MKRKRCLYTVGANGHDDSVTGIIAACEACADVDIGREDVHELALSLVTPLRSKDGGHCADCGLICWQTMRREPVGVKEGLQVTRNRSCSSPFMVCRDGF